MNPSSIPLRFLSSESRAAPGPDVVSPFFRWEAATTSRTKRRGNSRDARGKRYENVRVKLPNRAALVHKDHIRRVGAAVERAQNGSPRCRRAPRVDVLLQYPHTRLPGCTYLRSKNRETSVSVHRVGGC